MYPKTKTSRKQPRQAKFYLHRIFLFLIFFLLVPEPVFSQGLGFRGIGFRGGLTVDPDQGHLGVHLDLGEFVQNLRFQPNLEVGFGDDPTIIALNLEANYLFRGAGSLIPYAGGGLGINFFSHDGRSMGDDEDVEVGINFLAGLEGFIGRNQKLFGEIKLGAGDSPDFRLTLGITFLY